MKKVVTITVNVDGQNLAEVYAKVSQILSKVTSEVREVRVEDEERVMINPLSVKRQI